MAAKHGDSPSDLPGVLQPAAEFTGAAAGQLLAIALKSRPDVDLTDWRVVQAHGRISKARFEIDCLYNCRRRLLFGTSGKPEKLARSYAAQQLLWAAGFRPPSPFTVVEPVLCAPEHGLLVVEKAPGEEVLAEVIASRDAAARAIEQAADWLLALHHAKVPAPPSDTDRQQTRALQRSVELADAFPRHRTEIIATTEIAAKMLRGRRQGSVLGPCHGDAHPKNIFATKGRTTGIDLDKFAADRPEADVGHFLGQLACMGEHRLGSFAATKRLRAPFFYRYARSWDKELDIAAIGAAAALAILKSLHHGVCAYRSGKTRDAEKWVQESANAIAGSYTRMAI